MNDERWVKHQHRQHAKLGNLRKKCSLPTQHTYKKKINEKMKLIFPEKYLCFNVFFKKITGKFIKTMLLRDNFWKFNFKFDSELFNLFFPLFVIFYNSQYQLNIHWLYFQDPQKLIFHFLVFFLNHITYRHDIVFSHNPNLVRQFWNELHSNDSKKYWQSWSGKFNWVWTQIFVFVTFLKMAFVR